MVITDCERVHENGHPYAQVSNASNVGRFEGEGAVAVLASTVDLSCVSTTKRKRREVDLGPALQPEKRKKHKSTKEEDAEIEFDAVWICVECKEAECMMDPDATDLLICDDVCRRVFHYPCAGLQYLPSEDESFVCVDCRTRKHICSFCSNYGMDGEDVYKCRKKHCGLFFHESCLSMQNIDIYVAPELEIDPKIHTVNAIADATNVPSQLSFVCPAHSCWTCTQLELKELDVQSNIADNSVRKIKNGGRGRKKAHKPVSNVFESKTESFLTRCLECPIAYHVTCIPPSARFHELATLCHEHAGLCKLPDLNPEDSLQDRIEKKIDQKFDAFAEQQTLRVDKNATSTNSFFPSLSGKSATTRESTLLKALQDSDEANLAVHQLRFCLPCEFKDEVHSKPPNYRHVNALQIDHSNKPPRIPVSDDICHCVERCGESCINKMLYTECNGDIANQGNTNCAIGLNCGNRQLGQRKAAKCKPQREQGKGWGLCPIGNVEKGALVQEYVGDVVDSKEKEQRLIRWSEDHPNDTNFYVMALQSGWFIDARDVANLSRFVNHSCEPNCRLLQINVNGRMRCGIFALRDIDAGEFLSYDYHFDTRQGDRFVCCCGSRHCRGTMKGGSTQNDGNARKSKIELFEEAKASFERDKKFMADYYDDKEARKTQVGINVPGADVGNVDDTVANGPQLKHRPAVYCNRIFLWRTAVQGSDFSTRLASLENQPLTE